MTRASLYAEMINVNGGVIDACAIGRAPRIITSSFSASRYPP
jgi:hypothetical protein